jgi:hypothetical protein
MPSLSEFFLALGRQFTLMLTHTVRYLALARLHILTEFINIIRAGLMHFFGPHHHLFSPLLTGRRQVLLMLFQAGCHSTAAGIHAFAEFCSVIRARAGVVRVCSDPDQQTHTEYCNQKWNDSFHVFLFSPFFYQLFFYNERSLTEDFRLTSFVCMDMSCIPALYP